MYSRGEQFVSQLKGRIQWSYLVAGLGILVAAAMSWVMETDDTYWIWHRYVCNLLMSGLDEIFECVFFFKNNLDCGE